MPLLLNCKILIPQINAWSGASYGSEVIDHVYQNGVFEFTKEENVMALARNIDWVTLGSTMVKRVELNQIADTNRN